jgi:hypothetical protein
MSRRLRGAALISACLVALLAVTGCTEAPPPGDDPAPGDSVGAGVSAIGTELPEKLAAARVETSTATTVPGLLQDAATFELSPAGPLPAAVTLTFSAPGAPPTGEPGDVGPVIFTAESASGPWTAVPTIYDARSKSATITVDHFSFFTWTWVQDLHDIRRRMKQFLHQATTDAFRVQRVKAICTQDTQRSTPSPPKERRCPPVSVSPTAPLASRSSTHAATSSCCPPPACTP